MPSEWMIFYLDYLLFLDVRYINRLHITNLLIKEIYLHAIYSSEKNFLRVGQDSDICKCEFCIK